MGAVAWYPDAYTVLLRFYDCPIGQHHGCSPGFTRSGVSPSKSWPDASFWR